MKAWTSGGVHVRVDVAHGSRPAVSDYCPIVERAEGNDGDDGNAKVRVESTAETASEPRGLLCPITHGNGHVLEFAEWPDASWLAALMGAMAGPAR
jgi:hypothetical protein